MHTFARTYTTAALLCACVMGFVVSPAGRAKAAATLQVTTTADVVATDGVCSLREAIHIANTNPNAFADCGPGSATDADTIVLAPGAVYDLTMHGSQLLGDLPGDLDIADNPAPVDLYIVTNGAERATIRGAWAAGTEQRILEVAAGAAVELSGLVITGGTDENGGGIANQGVLTLYSVDVTGNRSSAAGGGIYNAPGASLKVAAGSEIRANTAATFGGGVFNIAASVVVEGASSIRDNQALLGGGGLASAAPYAQSPASVTLRETTLVRANTASDATAYGGGLLNGNNSTLSVLDSSVVQNRSTSRGGGVFNQSAGTLKLSGSVVALNGVGPNNQANAIGGGLANLGTATVQSSSISNNATGSGAGSAGHGIYTSGELLFERSTLAENGNDDAVAGGAINATGVLSIVSSTISDNRGAYAVYGQQASVGIYSSTVAGNNGGVALTGNGNTMAVSRSIVASNQTSLPDCSSAGSTSSEGHNILGAGCGAFAIASDKLGVDPGLLTLASNGGVTKTRALAGNSPARDVIPPAACKVVSYQSQLIDQRGRARPHGLGCDAGAYELTLEFAAPAPAPSIAKLQPASAAVGDGQLLVNVIGSNFSDASQVRLNGAARSTSYLGPTWLQVLLKAEDFAKLATHSVTVYTPAPGGGTSNPVSFKVVGDVSAPPQGQQPVVYTVFTPMVAAKQ